MRPMMVLLVLVGVAPAQTRGPGPFLKKADDWFKSDEAKSIAANILTYQTDAGSWPKNVSTTTSPYTGDRTKLQGTFDNGATLDELRYLARMVQATKDERYQKAFLKGLEHVLAAQYPNGGWPQHFPLSKGYHRHTTFNDNAMVRLMEFVREVATGKTYTFIDAKSRQSAQSAFDRGVGCILKCQIEVKGKKTAWCAQHDEKDFRPRPARTYELVSLSGAESVGIVRLLMSLEKPSPEVIAAIDAAVAWFEASKLQGIRVEWVKDDKAAKGRNKVVVKDPKAPPMWARFYEIDTNRPLYSDRDGVAKYDLAEIGYERRNGYAWLGTWPAALLEKEYPRWRRMHVGTDKP